MRLFIFRSETNKRLGAFAGTPDVEALPKHLGPWLATGVVRPENNPPHGLSRSIIENAVSTAGYQLFRVAA